MRIPAIWRQRFCRQKMNYRRIHTPTHVIDQAVKHGDKTALVVDDQQTTYTQLVQGASVLTQELPSKDNQRIAFLCERNAHYVISQWAIWNAGATAVPLYPHHSADELAYILQDSGIQTIIFDRRFQRRLYEAMGLCPKSTQQQFYPLELPSGLLETTTGGCKIDLRRRNFTPERPAQILYTSGTTGRPKGVVTTHSNIMHQIQDLVKAWEISYADRLLHFLPLHHTHGILCKLLTPLWAGATIEMLPNANTKLIWQKLAQKIAPPTIMMAVPTIYMKMLEELEKFSSDEKKQAIDGASQLRVTISGSMACPVTLMNQWEHLTGQRFLERYGMTELGMVLSNPLHGKRHAGYVGRPLSSVEARIVDEKSGNDVTNDELPGELRVRGPTVFHEYWGRVEETLEAMDEDEWFKTGDTAQYSKEKDSFRILGRTSVDIINSGGYKLSAIEIERVLLEHEDVAECAVVGIPNTKWEQIVGAVIRRKSNGREISIEKAQSQILIATRKKLAEYKIPRSIKFVEEIPKNAMGKINKKALLKQMFTDELEANSKSLSCAEFPPLSDHGPGIPPRPPQRH